MLENIALAASGSNNARTAEEFSLTYCNHRMVKSLLVIHVMDIALARYGDIDQLASGCCKNDFSEYIKYVAQTTWQNLHSRLMEKAALNGITIKWVQTEGQLIEQLIAIVKEHSVSTLIIGEGEPQKSFFGLSKNTAAHLLKKCPCKVIAVPPALQNGDKIFNSTGNKRDATRK